MDQSPKQEQQVRRPDECPFCRSTAVGTLDKRITSETYWRCLRCGEVWNVARLELDFGRYRNFRP